MVRTSTAGLRRRTAVTGADWFMYTLLGMGSVLKFKVLFDPNSKPNGYDWHPEAGLKLS